MNRGLKEHCPWLHAHRRRLHLLSGRHKARGGRADWASTTNGTWADARYPWNISRLGRSIGARDYHKLTFSMMYFYNERYLLPPLP